VEALWKQEEPKSFISLRKSVPAICGAVAAQQTRGSIVTNDLARSFLAATTA